MIPFIGDGVVTVSRLRAIARRVDEQSEGEAVARLLELVAQEEDSEEMRAALAIEGARSILLAVPEGR